MSYYIVNQPGRVVEAAAGMGAFVSQRGAPRRRAARTDRASVPPEFRARAARAASFRGFGAFEFSAAKVWSDMQACDNAWQASKTTVPQCGTWTSAVRGALGTLGYGQLAMGGAWGAADIGAYKAWCSNNGVSPGTYPTESSLATMETQLSIGKVTGGDPPIEYAVVGGELVPIDAVTKEPIPEKKGLNLAMLGLVAVGLIGVGALAIAAKRRGGRTTVVTGALPQTA
jgi:hypothetical protein